MLTARGRAGLLLVGLAAAVAVLSPVSARAAPRLGVGGRSVQAVAAAGKRSRVAVRATIDRAPGSVVVIGRVTGPGSRVALQRRSSGRWVERASGAVRKHGFYELRSPESGAAGVFRVAALRGSRVIALSTVLRPSRRPVVVSSQLRSGVIEVHPGSVRVVSGSPASGNAVLRLPANASKVRAGRVLVENASASTAGMIAIVTRVKTLRGGVQELRTRPGALKDSYSSLNVDVSGTLASLAGSVVPEHSRFRADVSGSGLVGAVLPVQKSFSCKSQGRTFTVAAHVDLSSLNVGVIVDLSNVYASISLSGQPQIDLDATFTQAATCTAEYAAVLGIKGTPIRITLGPDFTLNPSGLIHAHFTWNPYFSFSASKGLFTRASTQTTYVNHGGLTVNGNAQLNANFDILDQAGGGGLNLKALVGPEVNATANLNQQGQLCVHAQSVWKANETGKAAGINFDLGTLTWGFDELIHYACTGGPNTGGGSTSGPGTTSLGLVDK